jgi:hypothetical protein
MYSSTLFAVLALALLSLLSATPVSKRAVDFNNPTDDGGSWLDKSAGLGEPLNVSNSRQLQNINLLTLA